jgi:hypothetical protein
VDKLIVFQSLVLSNSDCQLEEISLVQRLRENIMASLYDCVCVVRYNSQRVIEKGPLQGFSHKSLVSKDSKVLIE